MTSYAFFQKKFVPLSEAKLGIMTNSLHYGTALFEGIRGNWNADQDEMYLFRLREHFERMHTGARLLKIVIPYSVDEMINLTIELMRKNGLKEDTYVRPLAYKSTEQMGVRLHNLDADFFMFCMPWGRYLDTDSGRCCVSTWRRPSDNTIPPQIKATGLYLNNALAKTEAIENGFDEGIMLSPDGYVSEGSGENIFLVINGKLHTPAVHNSILVGITRDTVMKLAKEELGIETVERSIARGELYTAQECFLTGTAAHLTPIGEIDGRTLGDGQAGPITSQLKKLYFDTIQGRLPKYMDWCTPVYGKA
ncbi:MAG: branched-chain amino acid transaminase [Dehalococcoidia bacterium]|nr:branched-chain amino acid transaminase [Dehalococcoidia bacterium]